ncbi:MAG: c-type cytochrome [Beijerinckiaceae bacterium]
MHRLIVFAAALTLAAGALLAYALNHSELPPRAALPRPSFPPELVTRGEKLASLGACAACHTRPGGAPYAGGAALHTPFGVIYATNITPEAETGIGLWSEEAFVRAMREGVDRKGRMLYPAFPYDHYTKATDGDLRALYAYFTTRKPVREEAKPNDLRFPFNIRPLLAGWNLLFLDKGPFRPNPDKSEKWNEGAYYVEGLGHCGACHSPRNALGAVRSNARLAGGDVDGWHAPGIGPHARAPATWTKDSLMNYLIDGWDARHGVAAGPMTPVVDHLARLDESMVEAIVEYLIDTQPEVAQAESEKAIEFALSREYSGGAAAGAPGSGESRGEEIFARACANCHKRGGQTTPLALGASMNAPHPGNVISIVMNGIKPPSGAPEKSMPRFAQSLSDEQIADLVTYMRARFTQKAPWTDTAQRVREMRAAR